MVMFDLVKVDAEAIKDIVASLQKYLEDLRRDWNQVRSSWSDLSLAWNDPQRQKFEPVYMRILATFAESERQTESFISFLNNQLTLIEQRKSRLNNLQ
jgi:hypothetical protein